MKKEAVKKREKELSVIEQMVEGIKQFYNCEISLAKQAELLDISPSSLYYQREMGLETVYPRKKLNLSQSDKQHRIYPYLLRGMREYAVPIRFGARISPM